MRERYLHRCRGQSFAIHAYAMSAIGVDVVSVHKLLVYRVVSHRCCEQSYKILQNRIWYQSYPLQGTNEWMTFDFMAFKLYFNQRME